jgi:hypothetical protein
MNIPKLSKEALAAIGATKPTASDPDQYREWLLARARSMSCGLRLVLFEIDGIGISLKSGSISSEHAARGLAALEQTPCYAASMFYAEGV